MFTSRDRRAFPRFAAAMALQFGANMTGLAALEDLGLNGYQAQAILVPLLAILAFLLNDRWVFRGARKLPAR